MTSRDWDDFHDTVVVRLAVEWKSGDVELAVRTSTGDVQIRARAARLVECPRRHPWGASICINTVRGPIRVVGEDYSRLEIEMQSGDVLILEADEFTLSG